MFDLYSELLKPAVEQVSALFSQTSLEGIHRHHSSLTCNVLSFPDDCGTNLPNLGVESLVGLGGEPEPRTSSRCIRDSRRLFRLHYQGLKSLDIDPLISFPPRALQLTTAIHKGEDSPHLAGYDQAVALDSEYR